MPPSPQKSNQAYYDEFAHTYEDARHRGYHALIDELEVGLLERYSQGKDVLEAGCGTGLILNRVRPFAARAVGFDLSPGMLEKARDKGLDVREGSVTEIPFSDEEFDVVYSFKVLPHVAEIEKALSEMARVLRPGGYMLAEFYNPLSLRYLVKRLKSPTPVGSLNDESVYTRYDSFQKVRTMLPPSMDVVDVRGVRVLTLASQLHDVPGLSHVFGWLERRACEAPILKHFGGFLIVVAQKRGNAWR